MGDTKWPIADAVDVSDDSEPTAATVVGDSQDSVGDIALGVVVRCIAAAITVVVTAVVVVGVLPVVVVGFVVALSILQDKGFNT